MCTEWKKRGKKALHTDLVHSAGFVQKSSSLHWAILFFWDLQKWLRAESPSSSAIQSVWQSSIFANGIWFLIPFNLERMGTTSRDGSKSFWNVGDKDAEVCRYKWFWMREAENRNNISWAYLWSSSIIICEEEERRKLILCKIRRKL